VPVAQFGKAVSLVEGMAKSGRKPDQFTFTAIVNACQRANEAEVAFEVFRCDVTSLGTGNKVTLSIRCAQEPVVHVWVRCCAVLCCAVLCCAVLCCAVLCCAVLCCAVLWIMAVCVIPAFV